MKNFIYSSVLLSALTFCALPVFAQADSSTDAKSYLGDTVITSSIKANIALDKNITNSNVSVTTNNGVVTLDGTVETDDQAADVIALAESVKGVKDVNSNLKISQGKHPVDDTLITGKVKGLFIKEQLFNNKDISSMSIHVETIKGIVYLTGTADNEAQAKNAVKLAKSVQNVKSVKSNIKVN